METSQHPLPEEIRKMTRDETVCKYCGVSYLIHNEIKALEDQLKKKEEELRHLRGSGEREAKLKEDIKKYQSAIDQYQTKLADKEKVISELTSDVKTQQDKYNEAVKQKENFAERLVEALKVGDNRKLQLEQIKSKLPEYNQAFNLQRTDLAEMKSQVRSMGEAFKLENSAIIKNVAVFVKKLEEDVNKNKSRLASTDAEIADLRDRKSELKKQCAIKDRTIDELSCLKPQLDELNKKCIDSENRVKHLEKTLEKEIDKSRIILIERDQYKNQISKKGNEMEDVISQHKRIQHGLEQSISILETKLKEREQQLRDTKSECEALKKKTEEHLMMEKEIERRANMTNHEAESLKDKLVRYQEDISALKNEREALIESHQVRIEQLRKSFKLKMAEMEKFPERLEEALKEERERNALEIGSLENKFKENFVLEMQIEKQKHQELIDKYINSSRDIEKKYKAQMNSSEHSHRIELENYTKQVKDVKNKAKEVESNLREEIEDLKLTIRKQQSQIGDVDTGSNEKVVELKIELQTKNSEINELTKEVKSKDELLAEKIEEIVVLQQTVYRECEERFELTDALSEMKEELLQLKKPSGGFSTPNKNSPSRRSSVNSTTSSNETGPKLTYTNRPRPENGVTSPPVPHPPSAASSSDVSVRYGGSDAKTVMSRLRGTSVTEARKRIAAAMGRR